MGEVSYAVGQDTKNSKVAAHSLGISSTVCQGDSMLLSGGASARCLCRCIGGVTAARLAALGADTLRS